jgi:hypothetical protein
MANFILLVAILLASASYVALNASILSADGLTWATDACLAAPLACNNPRLIAYVATGLGGLWILMKLVSALRD